MNVNLVLSTKVEEAKDELNITYQAICVQGSQRGFVTKAYDNAVSMIMIVSIGRRRLLKIYNTYLDINRFATE